MKDKKRIASVGSDEEGGTIIIHHKGNKNRCFHLATGLIAIGVLAMCGCTSNRTDEVASVENLESFCKCQALFYTVR